MYRRSAVMTLSPQELLQRHGIAYVATRTGKYTTKCPTCRGGYLNVKVDREGATWFCHGCGWDGPKSRIHANACCSRLRGGSLHLWLRAHAAPLARRLVAVAIIALAGSTGPRRAKPALRFHRGGALS